MKIDLDILDFYDKDKLKEIVFSFKGRLTDKEVTSILYDIELKLNQLKEKYSLKKKVYNILVECLQNVYHHLDESFECDEKQCSAIFILGKNTTKYTLITGNCIKNEDVLPLEQRLEYIKTLKNNELKSHYKKILNNGEMSLKGGGGLGMIDIAMKSDGNFTFDFSPIDEGFSFFTLKININR